MSGEIVWVFSIISTHMYRMTVGEVRMGLLRRIVEARRMAARFDRGSASIIKFRKIAKDPDKEASFHQGAT